jgi:hypothetical protein
VAERHPLLHQHADPVTRVAAEEHVKDLLGRHRNARAAAAAVEPPVDVTTLLRWIDMWGLREWLEDLRREWPRRGGTVPKKFHGPNGERLTIAEWSAKTGLRVGTIRARIADGWEPSRAVSTPRIRASIPD